MLQAQHQLDQLRLRKPLEFLPIHRQDESHTGRLGKGWVITWVAPLACALSRITRGPGYPGGRALSAPKSLNRSVASEQIDSLATLKFN